MRHRVALAVLILIWLAASVGPATAQGCDDCRELKQELRGGAVASAPDPTPPPSPAPLGWPAATRQPEPAVRAVLFWLDSCPHCHQVIDGVLPPLQDKYGDQLEILLIEVAGEREWNWLVQVGASFGIPQEQLGVPFLVIGDRALMGSAQIQAELPGLIEQHLAAGGVDYPDLPGLAEALPTATPDPEICSPATPCADETLQAQATATPAPVAQIVEDAPSVSSPGPVAGDQPPAARIRPDGFAWAIGIMAGMVGALVYTGLVLGFRIPPPVRLGAWLDRLTPSLALVGLGVAGYLAYVETQAVPAVCGPVGDCNAVQSSPYAKLFGVLPVGVLGAIGYVLILAAWLWGRLRSDGLARYAPLAVFGMSLIGVLFSLYLTYLEPFVIGAVCAWCLTSAVIITLLMLLSLRPALQAVEVR
jgi:uncharacterized membrane protein